MKFLKYIILLFIFFGSYMIGFLLSKKFKNRVNELRDFKNILNMIEAKIKFTYEPIGDIFCEISKMMKDKPCITSVLEKFTQNLKSLEVTDAWESSLENSKQFLNLNNEDLNIMKSFGKLLRKNRYRWTS